MIRVYGYSDDIVVIEGDGYSTDEVDCFNKKVEISFTDGTVINCGYPKEGMAVWYINVVTTGDGNYDFVSCDDEDADPYSDVFVTCASVESVKLLN